MAKKGRRSNNTRAEAPSVPTVNAKDAKIAAINTWADVADEEDAFHLQRDEVSLNAVPGRRQDNSDDEEEVMGLDKYGYESAGSDAEYDDSEDDEEEDPRAAAKGGKNQDDSEEEEEEEEPEEGWGTSKKDYYGGAEEEVDARAEEEEAIRIQQKHMAAMSAADFAFDDEDWAAPATKTESKKVFTELLPTKLPDTPEERVKLLHARHPEFQLLSEEFLELQKLFPALEMGAKAAEAVGDKESVAIKKWKVSSAYLGVLSMYFAILTDAGSDEDGGIDRVREHPIMNAILGVRSAWEAIKDARVGAVKLEPLAEGSDVDMDKGLKRKHDSEEESDDYDSEYSDLPAPTPKKTRTVKDDFSELDALISTSGTKTKKAAKKTTTTDFGEEAILNDIDAEEKSQRKKNLRFYASQVTSKANKRDLASRNAGGDADVPHRERRRERELRLQAEAQRRRDKGEGADLSDGEPDEPQSKKPAAPADDPDNEYYDLLKSTSKSRKEDKKKMYEAEKAAIKEGNMLQMVEGAVGPDGKREIGWKIMKNKGLTPKRKKEVRNPRVKKKMQYDKKMKKLGSTKAIYKGGQQGAYGGEATGIKKNVVKSVKFSS
jgi:U3 small nucleolar RNA-associated protein 3